jgi:hypothetical protein
MGEDVTPESPEAQQAPPPPSVAQLMDDATAAQGRAFDANLPRLGQYAQTMTDIQGQQAPQMLQQYLQNQRVGGPALVGMAVDMVKQADPEGFSLRQSLLQRAQEGVNAGGNLTDAETRRYQDDIRQAQINRGFGTGQSDFLEESAFMNAQRNQREQQRMASAMQVLSGRTPMDFFGQVNQAGKVAPFQTQDVSGMAGNLIPSTSNLMSFGQNAWGQNAANINNQNAMRQHQFEYGFENTYNPLMEDMRFGLEMANGVSGLAGTAVGTAAKAYTGCWVAIELYGKEAPKTHRVRAFVKDHIDDNSALGEFCREYMKNGEAWAIEVKWNQQARQMAKSVWDFLDELALSETAKEAA